MWGVLFYILSIITIYITMIPLWICSSVVMVLSSLSMMLAEGLLSATGKKKSCDLFPERLLKSKYDRYKIFMPMEEVALRAKKSLVEQKPKSKTGYVIYVESVGFIDGYDIIAESIGRQPSVPVIMFTLRNSKYHIIDIFGLKFAPKLMTNLYQGDKIKC